jgi:argininosuccinate lyase
VVSISLETIRTQRQGPTHVNSPSRSGVFSSQVDRRVEQFTESISFDIRLFRQDIQASIAHAQMLASVGYVREDEAALIVEGLNAIGTDIEAGNFQPQAALEDIHMHIEEALTRRLARSGQEDLGRRLHTARSRNDQVSTDMRLWVRASIDELGAALREIQRAFVGRADRDQEIVLPAYTHLQRAQPVFAAHYWLAYCEKFQRDLERLADCRRRTNRCPLGTAAVAGTSLTVDRELVASKLGFDCPTANSLDSSSDRDFVVEFAFAMSLVACHLSTWAEEWILWSTSEFGFIRLPQAYCTGSSIMPQKVNPDVLELIRGKSARVLGNLQTLLVLIQGLPLAYNRDLQEDKPPLFDSFDQVLASCQLAATIIAEMEFRQPQIAERLEQGYLDATTLMEYLIGRGVPQRTAHKMVGAVVRYAMDAGKPLADLTLDEFRQLESQAVGSRAHPDGSAFDEMVYNVLGTHNAVNAFTSHGSTAKICISQQLVRWEEILAGDWPGDH